MPKFIEIDGRRYAWKDIVRLRREEPTLFKVD